MRRWTSRLTAGRRRPGARDFSRLAGRGVILQLILIGSGPILARLLGPEGRGELAIVMVVSLMAAQTFLGGVGVAVSHAVAASGAPGRIVLRKQLPRWAAYGVLAGALASALTYVLLAKSGHHVPLGLPAAAAVITTFSAWMQILGAILRGEGDMRGITVIPIVTTSTYVAAVAFCFLFVPSADAVVVATIFLFTQGLAVALTWRRLRSGGDAPAADRRSLGQMARRSWATAVNTLGLGFEQVVVTLALGTHALGLYVVAVSMTNVPAMALRPVASMLMPRIVAAPPAASAGIIRRWVSAAAALDLLVVLALEVVIGPLIRILFGSEFTPAIMTARIMIVAWGFLSFRLVLTAVLQAQGRAGRASAVEVAATVVLVVLAYIGARTEGIEGVAAAAAATAVLACLSAAIQVAWRRPAEPVHPIGLAQTED